MREADRERFGRLLDWSQGHGAKLHENVEIYWDNVTRFSLRIKPSLKSSLEQLEPGFTAVTCPVSTTLSYLNALIDGPIMCDFTSNKPTVSSPPAFPPRFMDSLPPHVIGRFFLIKEYLKGENSFWWPYIATLPQPEQVNSWTLPAFWPEDDIQFLEGTNAHVAIGEIQANIKREYKQARKVLKEENFPNWKEYSQMLYKWAFSIFTSRSFRPSLILSQSVKDYVSTLLPSAREIDDFSILQPLFDIANHSMTATYTWDTTSDPNCCQLICQDSYRPGDQVFNNYGFKTNSELLLAYGFILPETDTLHNDYVHVRKRQQPEGENASKSDDQPKDFLISLRSMNDASSLAGKIRLTHTGLGSRFASLPAFAHFEPALVDDLASVISSQVPEVKDALEQWQNEKPTSEDRELPELIQDLVDRVKGALAGKLQYDYERLKQAEMEMAGENDELPPPCNSNQQLAIEYRMQCEKVLISALESLMEGEEIQDDGDGESDSSTSHH
ncbi:uncharacterized protein CTHT_0019870 [Thermochaetoides thermophila DSM 1495]|uniref:Uncharacterized protein n=1 Tax=Chaetomium thermophilum (strain DSM 1495 / CBS 144.50 / IMI 039719) TaxID=759272 RepID=G0S368_CHATD|nr:hypothetical protein CTHT_0019870 [Thermochaetoides thermophila DSM 1495]EGS22451.1 hypothetical protein CTHT_0019870 [Thermochaetoides thermophila DSM 1495]